MAPFVAFNALKGAFSAFRLPRRWEHRTPRARQVEDLAAELGGVAVAADLARPAAAAELLDEVGRRLGAVDVLVNNAAHCESPDTIDTLTFDGLERHYRVNAVAPGPIQTGWITGDLVEQVASVVPMGTVGEPADIADAVVFLASRQARWITGQVLRVAGGHAL
jgi:3-oxoacyl-[acyl-carrier protein] reductase